MVSDPDDGDDELETLCLGTRCTIVALRKVVKAYRALDHKRRGRLDRILKNFCDHDPRDLPQEQFTSEDRKSTGGKPAKEVMVYAFKVWQFRMYGVNAPISGKCRFVATEVDTDKKRDKADPQLLAAAARAARPFV